MNESYGPSKPDLDELVHHGVKGMKCAGRQVQDRKK